MRIASTETVITNSISEKPWKLEGSKQEAEAHTPKAFTNCSLEGSALGNRLPMNPGTPKGFDHIAPGCGAAGTRGYGIGGGTNRGGSQGSRHVPRVAAKRGNPGLRSLTASR